MVLEEAIPNQILNRADWLAGIAAGEIVTGTGLKPILSAVDEITAKRQPPMVVAQPIHWESTAAVVGQLGRRQYLAGRRDDRWVLEPFYFRPSYAEENRA
jgi:hypothetical protein